MSCPSEVEKVAVDWKAVARSLSREPLATASRESEIGELLKEIRTDGHEIAGKVRELDAAFRRLKGSGGLLGRLLGG